MTQHSQPATPASRSTPATPPDGFEPFHASPFLAHLAELYVDWSTLPVARFGCFVADHHANLSGVAHGGFLMALVDVVAGQGTKRILGYAVNDMSKLRMVTVSSNVDFLGPAQLGDWLDLSVTIEREAKSVVFASVRIDVGDRPVVRSSSVFFARRS